MNGNKELKELLEIQEVKVYYEKIKKRKISLIAKKIFDKFLAFFMLLLVSPIFVFIAIWIKLDSKGPVFYRQPRITLYGKEFKIFKFRTMVENADKLGTAVTLQDDPRISRVGRKLRKLRLDELPQLINILLGDMSFVGTRPEIAKYVDKYYPEMYATLLLPAGVTSKASIKYKDEDQVLEKWISQGMDADQAYIEKVLPNKMKYNLEYLENFSFIEDIKIMIATFFGVLK